jgi:hypothetical protein
VKVKISKLRSREFASMVSSIRVNIDDQKLNRREVGPVPIRHNKPANAYPANARRRLRQPSPGASENIHGKTEALS